MKIVYIFLIYLIGDIYAENSDKNQPELLNQLAKIEVLTKINEKWDIAAVRGQNDQGHDSYSVGLICEKRFFPFKKIGGFGKVEPSDFCQISNEGDKTKGVFCVFKNTGTRRLFFFSIAVSNKNNTPDKMERMPLILIQGGKCVMSFEKSELLWNGHKVLSFREWGQSVGTEVLKGSFRAFKKILHEEDELKFFGK